MPNALNYAQEYSRALAQNFPYVLYFGDLYAAQNNNVYRWVNAKTIQIPSISTSGRVNGDRDSIGVAARNYDNAWETKTLNNHRKWSTLVHPMDIDETNAVASIANITRVFNETKKFPEMDAYLISKLYSLWTALTDPATGSARAATALNLTVSNVLTQFDADMQAMTEKRVPAAGRILYVIPAVMTLIKNAQSIQRTFDVQNGAAQIDRMVNSLDQVKIVEVPPELMKTAYNFTTGWAVGASAVQIQMLLVHPTAVITPVKYEFAQLDAPSAMTEGKYYYFEESYEDVFILNNKADALRFTIAAAASSGNSSSSGT